MKITPRRNTSTLAPLTPAFQPETHITPDLKVEAALYDALQIERKRNDRLVQRIITLESLLKKWKVRGYARHVARQLTGSAR